MLKKLLLLILTFLLNSPINFINGMEDQSEMLTEKTDEISRLQALPPEILNIITDFLATPQCNNLVDHAQSLYDATKNLRLANKYFNETVGHSIKTSLSLNPYNKHIDQNVLDECNPNNKEGIILLLYFLLPSSCKEHNEIAKAYYGLLRYALRRNIIYMGEYNCLQYNFAQGSNKLIITIIETLYRISIDESKRSIPEELRIIFIADIIQAIDKSGRKSLFKKLASSLFKHHLINELSRKIINNNLDALDLSPENLCINSHGNFRQLSRGYFNPLKWAIIFDNTEAIQLILDYLDNNFPGRDHHDQTLSMLNFASIVAEPETLDYLLHYCRRYSNFVPNSNLLEYFKDPINPDNHPLQKTFDAGHEKNFLVLVKHGAKMSKLDMRETKANRDSQLFRKLVQAKRYLTYKQKEFENTSRQNISPEEMINIVDTQIKQRDYAQKILAVLGAGLIGFIGYKLFKKNNYSALLAKANLKIN